MKFLSETDFDFKGKTVLVRIDCDVDLREGNEGFEVDEDFRLRTILPTIKFLQMKGAAKIILMGHMGRPEGKVVEELSLRPVAEKLMELLGAKGKWQTANQCQISNFKCFKIEENICLLENLRFDKREEENDERFAKELAGFGDVFINEDFSVSHREHASIVGIPKYLPSFLGLRFEGEIRVLGDLRGLGKEKRPLVFVLGGSKKDKVDFLEFLGEWCDKVVVGGKLPLLTHPMNNKLLIGKLTENEKDIDGETIEKFKEEIEKAKTIIWAGPMGVYEEKENEKGTYEVAKAIADHSAFKVAGGGDTHRILSRLDIWNKFDFVSVGGGAMLYFLENGTLPAMRAIRNG